MPAGRPPHPDQLTPAEWRVVEAVRHGMTNAMIAERQGVSLDAVKFHVSAALRKLGLSNRRELRLWNGVRRDSRLEPGERPMCTGTSQKTIGQIARGVRDLDRAIAWYRDVLGLPLLFSFPGMAFFDCGGVRLYLSAVDAPANSVIYFQVRDLQAEVARLIEAGVTLVSAPHRIHVHEDGREEWMAFVSDPDGAPLGLMTMTEPAA